jgi:hypothetical protein
MGTILLRAAPRSSSGADQVPADVPADPPTPCLPPCAQERAEPAADKKQDPPNKLNAPQVSGSKDDIFGTNAGGARGYAANLAVVVHVPLACTTPTSSRPRRAGAPRRGLRCTQRRSWGWARRSAPLTASAASERGWGWRACMLLAQSFRPISLCTCTTDWRHRGRGAAAARQGGLRRCPCRLPPRAFPRRRPPAGGLPAAQYTPSARSRRCTCTATSSIAAARSSTPRRLA